MDSTIGPTTREHPLKSSAIGSVAAMCVFGVRVTVETAEMNRPL